MKDALQAALAVANGDPNKILNSKGSIKSVKLNCYRFRARNVKVIPD